VIYRKKDNGFTLEHTAVYRTNNVMSATSRIEYSEKYADEGHEYRYVIPRHYIAMWNIVSLVC
jgi:Cyclin-dependent kinase regulatory subunit